MLYRVIEGGFWRHGSIHIESDNTILDIESDVTGDDLYRELTEYLIEARDSGKFERTFNLDYWPEFFGVFTVDGGIIDVMVGEESSMWFVPQSHKDFETPTDDLEGQVETWLHGQENGGCLELEQLFPQGHPRVPRSVPGTPEWGEWVHNYDLCNGVGCGMHQTTDDKGLNCPLCLGREGAPEHHQNYCNECYAKWTPQVVEDGIPEDGMDSCLNCGEMVWWTAQVCPHCNITASEIP